MSLCMLVVHYDSSTLSAHLVPKCAFDRECGARFLAVDFLKTEKLQWSCARARMLLMRILDSPRHQASYTVRWRRAELTLIVTRVGNQGDQSHWRRRTEFGREPVLKSAFGAAQGGGVVRQKNQAVVTLYMEQQRAK